MCTLLILLALKHFTVAVSGNEIQKALVIKEWCCHSSKLSLVRPIVLVLVHIPPPCLQCWVLSRTLATSVVVGQRRL
jgi:hypothetical protein